MTTTTTVRRWSLAGVALTLAAAVLGAHLTTHPPQWVVMCEPTYCVYWRASTDSAGDVVTQPFRIEYREGTEMKSSEIKHLGEYVYSADDRWLSPGAHGLTELTRVRVEAPPASGKVLVTVISGPTDQWGNRDVIHLGWGGVRSVPAGQRTTVPTRRIRATWEEGIAAWQQEKAAHDQAQARVVDQRRRWAEARARLEALGVEAPPLSARPWEMTLTLETVEALLDLAEGRQP